MEFLKAHSIPIPSPTVRPPEDIKLSPDLLGKGESRGREVKQETSSAPKNNSKVFGVL